MSYSLLSSSSCLSSSSSPSLASLDPNHTKQDRSRSSHPLLHTHHVSSSHSTKHPSHCSHEEHREYTPSQLDLHRLELKLDMFSHDKQQQINELHKEMATIKTQLVTEMHKMRLDMQQELKLMEQRFRHQLQLVAAQFQQQQQSAATTPSMSVPDSLDHYDDERAGPSWFWPSYDFVDADCSGDGMGMGMNMGMGMGMGMHINSHTHMGMQHQANNTPQRGNRPPTSMSHSQSTPSVASNIAAITKPTPSHPSTIPTPSPSTSDIPPIEDLSDPAVAAASSAPLITPHTRKGSITETSLVALATRILSKHGSVPVGKMGSLLHKAANNHALPALLKERYGGLKKFLQSHDQYFTLGEDHPYNPHVALKVKDSNTTTTTATTTETSTDASSKTETTPSSPPTEPTSTDSPASPTPLDSTNAVSPISSSSSSGSSANTPPLLPLTARTTQRTTTTSECHALGMNAGMAGSTSSTTVTTTTTTPNRIGRAGSTTPPNFSNCLAIDCEMVGIGPGGTRSCLARCSIVNYHGQVIYDQYVRPTEPVTDYRTHVSGIRASDLENATEFHVVQKEVADLIKDRIIIAHSVVADLQALLLSHPPHLIRDTAFFPLLCPSRPRSLKCLVKERLGVDFQCGEHDSVEDARAVLAVYKSCAQEWEALITSGGCTHTGNMNMTTSTTTSTMVKEGAYSPPLSSHAMDVMLDTYHHHQKSSQFFY